MRGGGPLLPNLQPIEAPTEQEFTNEPDESDESVEPVEPDESVEPVEPDGNELDFQDLLVNILIEKLAENNEVITEILNEVKNIDKVVIVKMDEMGFSLRIIWYTYFEIAKKNINLFIDIINNLNKNKDYELNGKKLYDVLELEFK